MWQILPSTVLLMWSVHWVSLDWFVLFCPRSSVGLSTAFIRGGRSLSRRLQRRRWPSNKWRRSRSSCKQLKLMESQPLTYFKLWTSGKVIWLAYLIPEWQYSFTLNSRIIVFFATCHYNIILLSYLKERTWRQCKELLWLLGVWLSLRMMVITEATETGFTGTEKPQYNIRASHFQTCTPMLLHVPLPHLVTVVHV